jgi:enoyl-CoA hydratase/carnithine racemase
MSAELVHYAVSHAIAQITLDRAPVNALSMPLIDALLEALEKAKDDASVRAVIICSAHEVFCAGLDLDIVRGKRGTETKLFLERLYFAPTMSSIEWASRPLRRLTARRAPVA